MKMIHRIDPFLEMGPDTVDDLDNPTFQNDPLKYVLPVWEYWAGMVSTDPNSPYDLPYGTKVTLNVDYIDDPSVYFLVFRYPESYAHQNYPLVQVDLFFVIRPDDPEVDDVSELNGAQCGDCGRVNVEADKPSLVAPVWRIHPDTANMLCDDCADKRWKKVQ